MARQSGGMWAGCEFTEWPTIASAIKPLGIEDLRDLGWFGLTFVLFHSASGALGPRVEVRFLDALSYRVTGEEYATELWPRLHKELPGFGNTLVAVKSSWIEQLRTDWQSEWTNARHYLISTQDTLIEVLTATDPILRLLPKSLPRDLDR